jgi:hypothetical protein
MGVQSTKLTDPTLIVIAMSTILVLATLSPVSQQMGTTTLGLIRIIPIPAILSTP